MAPSIPTERDEQIRVVAWFARQYPHYRRLFWATPNGGSRHRIEAARMKMEGVQSGVPDLFLAVPTTHHHGLFIEMKRQKGGSVSATQREMIEALNDRGYLALVCRGADEAIAAIGEYLA